jgi:AcrR family transcriptional regulator
MQTSILEYLLQLLSRPLTSFKSLALAVPARQARSLDTQARILATFEHLIQARAVDEVTVADIARESGCSMSSLYARFPTKQVLIEAFFDEFFTRSGAEAAAVLRGPPPPSLHAAIEHLAQFLVRGYRRNRGVLRALLLHERQHPESTFGARSRELKRGFAHAVMTFLTNSAPVRQRREMAKRAVFGLWLVDTAVQHAILLDKLPGMDDRHLERQLADAWLAYLTSAASPH